MVPWFKPFNQPVTKGLVGWWKLDAGSGSTATDYEGSNDGTINGAGWTTDAKTGAQALNFDGSDDDVDIPDDTSLALDTEVSVMAWVKHDGLGSQETILERYDSGTAVANYALSKQSGDSPRFYFKDENGDFNEAFGPTISDTNYHHIAATWDGSTAKVYTDSASESTSISGSLDPVSANLLFGKAQNGTLLDGRLDDVRVYNRALSDSEVQTIYENTK